MKKKYFTQVGSSYQIADEIKKCVEFKEHNLLKDVYPSGYDLILCRNVVIYFTDEAKDMIYANFFKSLKNKGILFIGSTEQISNYKELGFDGDCPNAELAADNVISLPVHPSLTKEDLDRVICAVKTASSKLD